MKKVLIIGAGSAGQMVAREIQQKQGIASRYILIGFLDDNPESQLILGVPVHGTIGDAPAVIREMDIQEVIIAIPSAGKEVIQRIVGVLSRCDVTVKIVPGIFEIIEGTASISQVRAIEPSDLLGREEVGFDAGQIAPFYWDKTVLVTGAGGSIGSEILNQLLKLPVKKVTAFGHGETSIHNLIREYGNDPRFSYIIGDVRDESKLRFEFNRLRPEMVFHAAAHKHVPLMEDFPDESIKTNILGSYQAAKAAIEAGVSVFTMVSTDKAVNPASIMGACKRIAEKIVLSLSQTQKTTRFAVTRFGNVLGSRGSVIPVFQSQIEKGGPLTVTHPEITRFFMSIPEAAKLVIKSGTVSTGRIFVLDMGRPILIADLARALLKLSGRDEDEMPIVYTGLRKGEKMEEELSYSREKLAPSPFEKLSISSETMTYFNESELDTLIADFKKSAESYDPESIRQTIKKYLPEFRGDSR